MNDMILANPWAVSGPIVVRLPMQVPLTACVSIRLGGEVALKRPFGSPEPDFTNRIEIVDDRILVTAYCGEEIHVRWVESGGNPKTDLPPDPADSLYYLHIGNFRASPFSRRMTLLVTKEGKITDVTEPLIFHHWLDDYYQPGLDRPLRILLDVGIGLPVLLILIAGWIFQVKWAQAMTFGLLGILVMAGGAKLFYRLVTEKRFTDVIGKLLKSLRIRPGR
ncbi:MAG: hypothetical protein K0B16_16365 [Burkholderiaceae bacterium]|nr:hypothetical protein [Burkholderiaceae bacterium]